MPGVLAIVSHWQAAHDWSADEMVDWAGLVPWRRTVQVWVSAAALLNHSQQNSTHSAQARRRLEVLCMGIRQNRLL